MSTRDFLAQEVQRLARHAQERRRQKQAAIRKKKAEILQMEKELDSPPSNPLDAFIPNINGVNQCPQCWADNRIQSPLENNPRETGTNTEDFLRCNTCHYTCSIGYNP